MFNLSVNLDKTVKLFSIHNVKNKDKFQSKVKS